MPNTKTSLINGNLQMGVLAGSVLLLAGISLSFPKIVATRILKLPAEELVLEDFAHEAEFMGAAHGARAIIAGSGEDGVASLVCIRQQDDHLTAWMVTRPAGAGKKPRPKFELLSHRMIDKAGVRAFCSDHLA